MAKVKAYSVNYDGVSQRFVATTSMRKAAELCRVPVSHFQKYGHVTGGTRAEMCMKEPGAVWSIPHNKDVSEAVKLFEAEA